MKAKLVLMILLMCVFRMSHGQLTFSVSPGFSMNSASFGFKMGRFVPFAGIQFYSTGGTFRYEYEEFDMMTNQVVKVEDDYSFNARLLMPNAGVKYFIKETGNLKAHLTLNISKPIVSGKAVYNGDEDEDLEDYVKGLSLWGGEFSFGVEYFFDEHFSLGGEFGMRYLRVGFHDEQETTVYNPVTGLDQPSTSTYDMKFNASPTFSKISLNFYF